MTMQEARANMSLTERVLVGGAGSVMLYLGLRTRLGAGVGGLGIALLGMSVLGRSPVNAALGIRRSPQGGIVVKKAITVGKPVSEVYAYWRRLENLPNFMNHLERVEERGAGKSHWVARAPAGLEVSWDAEITKDREGQYLAWRSLEGSTIPNSGEVEFKEAPGGRGTEVHVRLEYSPPGGTLGAAFARLLGEEPSQQIQDDLMKFKRLLELGYAPTVVGQSSGRPSEGAGVEGVG